MKELGNYLSQIRKSKGFSQEDLAESANINLRTVQRIEAGETEPHGNTLRNICRVLQVQIEEIYDFNKEEDNGYIVLMYLSVMIFIILPLGNIILPLVLWLSKKNKVRGVSVHGREILNFQLTWTILFYLPFTFYAIPKFTSFNLEFIRMLGFKEFILYILIMGIVNFLYAVLGSIFARKGYRLPTFVIPFIRK